MKEVLVFKTNASRRTNLRRLNRFLKNAGGIASWNFDFDDCDHIFRLVSTGISSRKVLEILAEAGIDATELEDQFIPSASPIRSGG